MPVIPANLGVLYWSNPRKGWGSFRPTGEVMIINPGAHPNPVERRPGQRTVSARFFVGFNVGSKPTWKVKDIIKIVQQVRSEQGRPADASFIAQKGIYSSGIDRSVVVEDGAQIVIFNFTKDSAAKFTEQMIALGKALRKVLKQERIILETQRAGVTIETIGIT
jgi:hypothetical protein